MRTTGIILLVFALLRLLISLINLLWRHRTSYLLAKLKSGYNSSSDEPQLKWSLLIPARNEEENIGILLNDVTEMRHKPYELIIYNDNSSDNTLEVAESFRSRLPQLEIINGKDEHLSAGWLGKTNACNTLGKIATGEFLLFADADVRLGTDLEDSYINYAAKRDLALLSIFPYQIMLTNGERESVPVMNWILLSLLPLPLVRYSSFSSLAAANGQFMLFRQKEYKSFLPHEKFKGSHAEDIEISRYFKRENLKTETLTGNSSVRCRMYHNKHESIEGFSKNVLHFFGNSAFAAILFWIVTSCSALWILLFNNIYLFCCYLLTACLIRIITSLASGHKWSSALLNSLFLQINFGLMISKALYNKKKRNLIWKGRNIY